MKLIDLQMVNNSCSTSWKATLGCVLSGLDVLMFCNTTFIPLIRYPLSKNHIACPLLNPGCDLPRWPSLRHRETQDPGCSSSGRRNPGPGRRLLPLRSSTSHPGTASLLSARLNVTLNESVAAVMIHAGANDTKLRQTETLKRYFRSLIEMVCSTSPATTIIVSGPLPMYRRGHELFSRLFALNEWLFSWCKEQKIIFVNNCHIFWERPRLFRADGLHPSRVWAELLSDNITRMLRSIWLVSQFSKSCYDDFCSTHLNDKGTCSVKSIQTVSVPQIVRSKYKFSAGSRTNLIVIKPGKCKINEQKQFLKLGLLNIRSLTPKAVIVNEMITDNSFDVLRLTETWLKTNDYFGWKVLHAFCLLSFTGLQNTPQPLLKSSQNCYQWFPQSLTVLLLQRILIFT